MIPSGGSCNAFNENSVHRLRQLKRRPEEKPFILLASSLEMVKKYVANIHPRVETLLQYHQRPLTVIYEQVNELPDYLLTEEKQAAIRVSLDPFTQSLINKLGNPIISTSANYTSDPYPLRFEDIDKDIIKEVDAVYPFGVEELSKCMHADRTHLFRRCKEVLGMSPSDYLRETRLAHGHQLLELGSGNVSEVAYASGFDSLSRFTPAFKARFGAAPSQVRARAAS